jgi:hypothetical protein
MHVRVLEAPPGVPGVPAPSIRTPDPLITIQRPDGDDAEITEVIPPPASRKLAPPHPSAPPQCPERSSVAATDLASPAHAHASNPLSADHTLLDGPTAVAVPKPRGAFAVQPPSEVPAPGSHALRRLTRITIAGLLVLLILLAILGVIRK